MMKKNISLACPVL